MRLVAALMAVLLAACASSGTDAGARGRVAGRVLSAPSCPVERAGSPCPPRPVSGASVVAVQSAHQVAAAKTDSAGRFELRVAAGSYVIRATNVGGLATTAERTVAVAADATVRVTLVVDSGIR